MEYTSLGCTGLKNGMPYHDSETLVVAPKRGILKTLFNFFLTVEVDDWNHQLRKSTGCDAKESQLNLILVIVASCLIFPINICKFVLHKTN